MPSNTDYHPVNTIGLEGSSRADDETTLRGPHPDNECNTTHDTSLDAVSDFDSQADEDRQASPAADSKAFALDPGFVDRESWAVTGLAWIWDIFLTLSPIFFIALAITALKLNGALVSTSKYGERVLEITRVSPTVYPIVFAMIASRFYKSVARWRLEQASGITVLSLEQLSGSQSFASALERLITVRARLLGGLILLTWAMSPLGGQSSSRLIDVGEMNVTSTGRVYYDNRAHQLSIFFDLDKWTFGAADIIPAIYSGNLVSPRAQQLAFSDLWGRQKIPQWPWELMMADIDEDAWRQVDQSSLKAGTEHYTSLLGVNVQSLDFSDNSTLYNITLQSEYFSFNCSHTKYGDSRIEPRNVTFWQRGFNTTDPDEMTKVSMQEAYIVAREYNASFTPLLGYSTEESLEPWLLFLSGSAASENYLVSTVFNCSMVTVNLQTNITCADTGCSPQMQARVHNTKSRMPEQIFHDAIRQQFTIHNALGKWPGMTAVARTRASATESFIANDDVTYANQGNRDWTGFDTKLFSQRLATAFNTAWEAGINPFNTTDRFSPVGVQTFTDGGRAWTNQTTAQITKVQKAYYANHLWVVLLLLTTIVLQVLAVGGLALQCMIRGPDILGFASSLTRDNSFAPVSGGSHLGGADRARSLKNMRVQLADVAPKDVYGHIAMSVVSDTNMSLKPSGEKRMYL